MMEESDEIARPQSLDARHGSPASLGAQPPVGHTSTAVAFGSTWLALLDDEQAPYLLHGVLLQTWVGLTHLADRMGEGNLGGTGTWQQTRMLAEALDDVHGIICTTTQ